MGTVHERLTRAYTGKRVLVTGHTGFKGSWLVLWLKELGAEITGYALDPQTSRDNFVLSGAGQGINDVRGDVRDETKTADVVGSAYPEIVFHLAAQSQVLEGYLQAKETYDVNVGGTVNILEACRKCGSVKAIIVVTSDKCYENRELLRGYHEGDRLGGFDPYSSSKACQEMVAAAYRNAFFSGEGSAAVALSTVRAGNVIGGGDWSEHRLIPDCVRALEAGVPIKIRAPEHKRPWQYVLEPLGGYLVLAEKMASEPRAYSEAWNFGPSATATKPVKELVRLMIKAWGSGTWETVTAASPLHEARLLALNIRKARARLPWRPAYGLSEAVRRTMRWYKRGIDRADMSAFCRDEILAYMKRMPVS